MDNESISMFLEITGETSTDVAINYLTVSEGNTEQAIALYLESGGLFSSASQPSAPVQSVNMEWQEPIEERAPIPSMQEQLLDDFSHDEFMMGNSLGTERRVRAFSVDSDHDERETKLSNLFRAPSQMVFAGTLDSARSTAKNSKKFLLITIVDPGEFTCLALNRDLWADQDVKTLIKENFIFLYLESDSSEGKRHSAFYPIDNYPYIAIIDPITGERLIKWNIPLTPIEFQSEVLDFLDNPHGNVISKQKEKSVSELSEAEQLKLALAASMGKEDDSVEILESLPLQSICSSIKPLDAPEPIVGDITRIQFRLPNGSRLVRKFLKTDKVSDLFGYIKAAVPDSKGPFELLNFRSPLLSKIKQSLTEAKVEGASLTLDYI